MLCFWMSTRRGQENKYYLQLFCNLCYNTSHEHQDMLPGGESRLGTPGATLSLGLYNLPRKRCIFCSLMMLWANSRGQNWLPL